MADEARSDDVLQRAHDDDSLSDEAREVVLAACRGLAPGDPLNAAMTRLDATVEMLARRRAAALATPAVDEVDEAASALRTAAGAQFDAERAAGVLSADRIQFLETSLEFRDRHGTQPCPVCDQGTLDDQWVVRARAALAAEKDATGAMRSARSGVHRARQRLTGLVRGVEAPPAEDAGLTTIVAARVAYQAFSAFPADDDVAYAEHVTAALPALRTAYDALRAEAASRVGEAGADEAASLESAREAQEWLRLEASSARP
jgi:hypothetical protein